MFRSTRASRAATALVGLGALLMPLAVAAPANAEAPPPTGADLSVIFPDGQPSTAVRGEVYTYAVLVINDGPQTATRVRTEVVLPPGAELLDVGNSPTVKDRRVIWLWPSLPQGGLGYSFTVRFTSTGPARAFAAVISDAVDPRPLDNLATDVVTVRAP
ncbi:hypothetical protein ACH3VR_06610 [Microbacterium sp. B2969]|uniref:DUF11 domain-containing protein n=1 Tax=Microbacterium alkaliflavum TaxID=3248839 RepID=A0ABW7Q8X9_9MICO